MKEQQTNLNQGIVHRITGQYSSKVSRSLNSRKEHRTLTDWRKLMRHDNSVPEDGIS